MNKKAVISLIIGFTILFIIYVGAFDLSKNNDHNNTIDSADKAIDRAIKISGFKNIISDKNMPTDSIHTAIDIVRDTVTPFISGEITGRKAWHVYFNEIILDLDETEYAQEKQYPKNVEIVLDSATGQLLKVEIVSTNKFDSTYLYRNPTAEESTRLLSALGEEYHGIPSESASITFSEALSKCFFFPLLAKIIDIRYVLYSFHGSEPTPAWVIYMRGLPPTSGIEGIPDFKTTNRRTVVNAITGDKLITNNLPYPNIINDNQIKNDSSYK